LSEFGELFVGPLQIRLQWHTGRPPHGPSDLVQRLALGGRELPDLVVRNFGNVAFRALDVVSGLNQGGIAVGFRNFGKGSGMPDTAIGDLEGKDENSEDCEDAECPFECGRHAPIRSCILTHSRKLAQGLGFAFDAWRSALNGVVAGSASLRSHGPIAIRWE
jgi:hypothetical protein